MYARTLPAGAPALPAQPPALPAQPPALPAQPPALRVAVAGGLPVLVRHADGGVEPWSGSAVLGVPDGAPPAVRDVPLPPGAVLVACTSGVTGARFRSERFGGERLAHAVQRAGADADEVADAVLSAVRRFATDPEGLSVVAVGAAAAPAGTR
ncbi:MAG: SpoIIE family protein phosphatase [Kineosporiaceae bacterium]